MLYELCHVTSRLVMSTHTPNPNILINNEKKINEQTNKTKNKTLSVKTICRQLIKRELERVYTRDMHLSLKVLRVVQVLLLAIRT